MVLFSADVLLHMVRHRQGDLKQERHRQDDLKQERHITCRVTSNRRELGRTDKGQVREIQNITSRFPTVLLSSLMMF